MKYIMLILMVILLPFTASGAHNNPTPIRAGKTVSTKMEKPQTQNRNLLQRIFGLGKPKAPVVVARAYETRTRPVIRTQTRQPSGQRSARTSVTRIAPAAIVVRPMPSTMTARTATTGGGANMRTRALPSAPTAYLAPREQVRRAETPSRNVLAVAPKAQPEMPKWKPNYRDKGSVVVRAWERAWDAVTQECTKPAYAAVKRGVVRLTAFHNGDSDSAAGRSATGPTLRTANEHRIGVAAGVPSLVGSYVRITLNGRQLVYFVADTGSDLVTRAADTRNAGQVIDLYAPGGQQWDCYQEVEVIAVAGAAHYLLADPLDRERYLSWETYQRACALAGNGS